MSTDLIWRGDLNWGRLDLRGRYLQREGSWRFPPGMWPFANRIQETLEEKKEIAKKVLQDELWYKRPRLQRMMLLTTYWVGLPDTITKGFIDSDIPAQEPFFWEVMLDNRLIQSSYEEADINNNDKRENWFRFHGYNEDIWKGFIISGVRNGNAALIQHSLCEWVGKTAWKWCIDALRKNWVQEIYTAFSEKNKTNEVFTKKSEMYEEVSIDELTPEIKEKLGIQDISWITLFRVK